MKAEPVTAEEAIERLTKDCITDYGVVVLGNHGEEGIKKMFRAAMQWAVDQVTPERIVNTKEESDVDWWYGKGYNTAIDELEEDVRRLGLEV